jgi:hypothetical protein
MGLLYFTSIECGKVHAILPQDSITAESSKLKQSLHPKFLSSHAQNANHAGIE